MQNLICPICGKEMVFETNYQGIRNKDSVKSTYHCIDEIGCGCKCISNKSYLDTIQEDLYSGESTILDNLLNKLAGQACLAVKGNDELVAEFLPLLGEAYDRVGATQADIPIVYDGTESALIYLYEGSNYEHKFAVLTPDMDIPRTGRLNCL